MTNRSPRRRLPPWLKSRAPGSPNYLELKRLVKDLKLHTVCESAHCPNIGECWGNRTATFMILGDICTRSCGFCAIKTGRPQSLDEDEPQRVAQAVARLDLRHAVITSVNRDELPDGGAYIFARTLEELHLHCPTTTIEVLIPDFQGDWDALKTVLDAGPEILNHNIETPPRLYPQMRPQAKYERSLELLERAYDMSPTPTKSGLMLGAGETSAEIAQTIRDLADVQCSILTLGQYLPPSDIHVPLDRFVTPTEFDEWRLFSQDLGFHHVESGPLVRSSYHAEQQVGDLQVHPARQATNPSTPHTPSDLLQIDTPITQSE